MSPPGSGGPFILFAIFSSEKLPPYLFCNGNSAWTSPKMRKVTCDPHTIAHLGSDLSFPLLVARSFLCPLLIFLHLIPIFCSSSSSPLFLLLLLFYILVPCQVLPDEWHKWAVESRWMSRMEEKWSLENGEKETHEGMNCWAQRERNGKGWKGKDGVLLHIEFMALISCPFPFLLFYFFFLVSLVVVSSTWNNT